MARHGLAALLAIMLADQLALPVPMDIFILAAGGLVGTGRIAFLPTVATLAVAGMFGNAVWYYLGYRHGNRILKYLCRISIEPDSCVRRTQNLFTRFGVRALLVAKFVPGLNTVAAPLAGVSGVGFARFLAYITAGLLLWIAPSRAAGMSCDAQLYAVAAWGGRTGCSLDWIVAALGSGYFLYKFARRWQLIRILRMARVTPEEVRARLEGRDAMVIVDLRNLIAVRT